SPAIAGLACTQWGQPPCGSRRRAARLGSRAAPPPGDGRPLRGRSHRPSGSIFCLDAFGTVAPDPFRATALVGRTRNNLSPAALLRDSFGASLPPRLRSTPRALWHCVPSRQKNEEERHMGEYAYVADGND